MKGYLLANIFFLLLLIVVQPAYSQKAVSACRITEDIIIDGFLDEPAWQLADSAVDFVQMEPAKGEMATERTVVNIAYDDEKIYFGIHCFQKDPSTIVAGNQSRDQLSKTDDLIAIILDTYNDNRSGMVFFVNPLGVQIDMKVADDGRSIDLNWDAEWESAVAITDRGWSVELAIPFQSLTYNKELNSWGFNIGRLIRNNIETSYWAGPASGDFRISQSGILTGLETPDKKKIIELTPYFTLKYEDSDETGNHNKILPQAGLDAHINISSNVVSHLTYNPDFATVEGDMARINMTRWELSFPEKRLFFQEGNELFKTRIKTFYSRRIGDINFGGKINGKIKDFNFYVMDSQTKADDSMGIPSANYTAVRVKKDILNSSSLGFSYVDKKTDTSYVSSASIDYMLNLGKTWKITGQMVASFPEVTMPASAYFVRVAKENNIYHVHLRYSYTGEQFKDRVNETGFIRDDDMKELDSDINYMWWFKDNGIKYISVSSWWNVFWSTENVMRSWGLSQEARMYLQNRFSLDVRNSRDFKLYEKVFYNYKTGMVLGYNSDEWSMGIIAYYKGRNFDDDFSWLQGDIRLKLFKKLSIYYSLNKLDYSPDKSRSTLLNIISVDYNFTNNLWIRVFAQNNTRDDRTYFYGKFGWRFQPPFGAVYFIYTSDTFEDPLLAGKSYNDIAFLKFSYRVGF